MLLCTLPGRGERGNSDLAPWEEGTKRQMGKCDEVRALRVRQVRTISIRPGEMKKDVGQSHQQRQLRQFPRLSRTDPGGVAGLEPHGNGSQLLWVRWQADAGKVAKLGDLRASWNARKARFAQLRSHLGRDCAVAPQSLHDRLDERGIVRLCDATVEFSLLSRNSGSSEKVATLVELAMVSRGPTDSDTEGAMLDLPVELGVIVGLCGTADRHEQIEQLALNFFAINGQCWCGGLESLDNLVGLRRGKAACVTHHLLSAFVLRDTPSSRAIVLMPLPRW